MVPGYSPDGLGMGSFSMDGQAHMMRHPSWPSGKTLRHSYSYVILRDYLFKNKTGAVLCVM